MHPLRPFPWFRWRRLRPPALGRRPRQNCRLRLECLEERSTPAVINWINPAGGDWDTASNWSSNSIPTAADTVIISSGAPGAVVDHTSLQTATVAGLVSAMDIHVTGGTLVLNGNAVVYANLVVDGGFLQLYGSSLQVSGIFQQTDGITFLNGKILASPNTIQLRNGVFFAPGVINGSLDNDGGAIFINAGDVLQVTGKYTQGPAAALLVGIGTGPTFGQLQVGGAAGFAGTMQVIVAYGFISHAGDVFPVVSFSSSSGSFTAPIPSSSGSSVGPTITVFVVDPTYAATALELVLDPVVKSTLPLAGPVTSTVNVLLTQTTDARINVQLVDSQTAIGLAVPSTTVVLAGPTLRLPLVAAAADARGSGGVPPGSSGGVALDVVAVFRDETPALASDLDLAPEREELSGSAIARSLLTGSGPRGNLAPVAMVLREAGVDAVVPDNSGGDEQPIEPDRQINPLAPLPPVGGGLAPVLEQDTTLDDLSPVLNEAYWAFPAEVVLAALVAIHPDVTARRKPGVQAARHAPCS